jgi:hypothetical protein
MNHTVRVSEDGRRGAQRRRRDVPHGRFICVAAIAVALASALTGCGSASPVGTTIHVPAPPPAAPLARAQLAEAPTSTLTAALEIELETVRAQIEAALPRAHAEAWTRITEDGASPRIELRYFVERDPVKLSFADGALRTEVVLRYWADVRGAIKSPLPFQRDRWFDLDRDQSWGTREQPQRATLVVASRVQLDAQGNLRVRSRVDPIDPGEPPAGSFCIKVGISLCVGKQTFAGQVRRAFAERVEPMLHEAVSELDRRLAREADLRARLRHAWQTLQCPLALHRAAALTCKPDAREQGTWLQVTPERVSASELSRRGKRLRVLVSITGKLRVTHGGPPAPGSVRMPWIGTRALDETSALHVPVALPYPLLAEHLSLGLPSSELALGRAGKARLVAARITGAGLVGERARLLLQLSLRGDVTASFYVHAAVQAGAAALRLEDLQYTAESEQLLVAALPDADHEALRRTLARTLRIELDPVRPLLSRALALALDAGQSPFELDSELTRIALSSVQLGPQSLHGLLGVEGTIRVRIAELTPTAGR